MFKKIISIVIATAMCFAMAAFFASCSDGTTKPTDGANKQVKIGIILVGDANEGYTAVHMEGIKEAQKALNISDDQIIYKYKVDDTTSACYDAAVELVNKGCTYIFSNSYGHQSYMKQAAEEYPDVTFCAGTGDNAAASGLPNLCNYFNYTFESRYVSGVVAGMKLKQLMDEGKVTDPKVGYVGAYPYAEVVSGYTAFLLGIQSIVPDAYMEVQYTNSWFDPTAEAECANALISKGCHIISQHADSTGAPSACETALNNGTVVYCVGYNVDMLNVAPNSALTSAQNNWSVYYTYAFDCILKGEKIATDWAAGYNKNAVMISTLGNSCAPGTAEKVEEVENAIKNGTLHVFDTSKFTVNGQHLNSYTNAFGMNNKECIWDGYFHESELRSAPYFDIKIDGIIVPD